MLTPMPRANNTKFSNVGRNAGNPWCRADLGASGSGNWLLQTPQAVSEWVNVDLNNQISVRAHLVLRSCICLI